MAAKKDLAGKDKEPQLRGKSGPASSTPNEEGRARARGGRDKGVPKIPKSRAADRDARGGGQH